MLLIVLYFTFNPNTVSVVEPDDIANLKISDPTNVEDGYTEVSENESPTASYKSNTGCWFTFVFCCDSTHAFVFELAPDFSV